MKLYGYWRSSSSWRVRIALQYKGLQWTHVPVNLIANGGEQHQPKHLSRNPFAQVPVLELDDGTRLAQSMAIMEFLEEEYPSRPLLPQAPIQRARARQLAEIINSGIQPLQNLATMRALAQSGHPDSRAWAGHFMSEALGRLNGMAEASTAEFLVGTHPTFADLCLIPQLYNARRFGCHLDAWPRLLQVEANAFKYEAFSETRPESQPDAIVHAA